MKLSGLRVENQLQKPLSIVKSLSVASIQAVTAQ